MTVTTREALTAVLAQELRRSPDTIFLGETVRGAGAAGVAAGLYEEFGPTQIIETPVSENGIFGAALGLALSGMRPIVEIYSADFLLAVANEVLNDMAKWRQQQGRCGPLSITIRGCMGAAGGLGPEHSQSMESYLHHAPGLVILIPATPRDAAGLLRSAIRAPDPVIVLEHRRVYDLVGDVPDDPDFAIPIGSGDTVRPGRDVTIVAWAWMRHEALSAAQELAAEGIEAEVIDPRTIRPMNCDEIVASVCKTGCLVVAEEAPVTGSIGSEILAQVLERARGDLRAARRVAMADVIHPYSADMEAEILPRASDIANAVRQLLA